jgi:hypothetical protein
MNARSINSAGMCIYQQQPRGHQSKKNTNFEELCIFFNNASYDWTDSMQSRALTMLLIIKLSYI